MLSRSSGRSQDAKYELFALKLLKQCLELVQKSGECSNSAKELLEIGCICIESLRECSGSGKAPPLSFEKLLLHFASQCFTHQQPAMGQHACETLYSRLQESGGGKEERCLLAHTYDILWKAASRMEQLAAVEDSVGTCLHLRRTALTCLLDSSPSPSPAHLLLLAKVHIQLVNVESGCGHDHIAGAMESLRGVCVAPVAPCCLQDRHAYQTAAHILRLVLALSDSHDQPDLLQLLSKFSGQLSTIAKSQDLSSKSSRRLTDSIEFLVSTLKDQWAEGKGPEHICLFLRQAVSALLSAVTAHSELVELQLRSSEEKPSTAQEKSLRSRQLTLLSFPALVLESLLQEEGECEEIETMRNGSSRVCTEDLSNKKSLAALCLPLLQLWQGVVSHSGTNVLCMDEHHWLGCEAYNLGLCLYRCQLFPEAAAAVDVACQELSVWCGEEEGRAEEVSVSCLCRVSVMLLLPPGQPAQAL